MASRAPDLMRDSPLFASSPPLPRAKHPFKGHEVSLKLSTSSRQGAQRLYKKL